MKQHSPGTATVANAETEPYQTDLTEEQRCLLALIVARHAAALPDADRAALLLALDKFGSGIAFTNYVRGWGEARGELKRTGGAAGKGLE